MGVEFNLKVVEEGGRKLFELSDAGTRVLFNKLSAGFVMVTGIPIVVERSDREMAGGVRAGEQGVEKHFLCLDAPDTPHAKAFDKDKKAPSLCAEWYETGSVIGGIPAQGVSGHDFSAIQLIVSEYRGQEMKRARENLGEDVCGFHARCNEINTITKAAVQPSDTPQILVFG